MESSPSPVANRSSSLSISSGAMSSSLRASTISFFNSSSSSSTTESFRIVAFNTTHQLSHSQRSVFAVRRTRGVQAIPYLYAEKRATMRYYPPVLAPNKSRRIAGNRDQLNMGLQEHGDIGESAAQVHRLARYGASSLGEDDQAVAFRQCVPAGGQHGVELEIVTDVAGVA